MVKKRELVNGSETTLEVEERVRQSSASPARHSLLAETVSESMPSMIYYN